MHDDTLETPTSGKPRGRVSGGSIHLADVFSNEFPKDSNILLGPDLESEEEITAIYHQLAEEGKVEMELQDTFWGAKHAIVKDRNGISWELNYTKQ